MFFSRKFQSSVRFAGIVVVIGASGAACSKTTSITRRADVNPPSVKGGDTSTGGKSPGLACKQAGIFSSPVRNEALSAYFAKAAGRFNEMSQAERKRSLVDRDVKGHVITANPADSVAPPWSQKDPETDKIPGTATERAYREMDLTQGKTVTVAIIDTGIEFSHEDLKGRAWVNETEAQGTPGKDNDGNGYAGDVNGWNYLVSKTGADVNFTNLEVTRELIRLKAAQAQGPLSAEDQAYMDSIQKTYDKGRGADADVLQSRIQRRDALQAALELLAKDCFITADASDADLITQLAAVKSDNADVKNAVKVALNELNNGWDLARFKVSIDTRTKDLEYYYGLNPDPSEVVADKGADVLNEVGYGNANIAPVNAADEEHATHVAGIIGAIRGNALGMDGQATNVKLISLRAVPNGDERDKDIGNAIRYAVDQGARVVNMSFGKAVSPHKEFVWDAIRYANKNGVLLVHAAGNDNQDKDDMVTNPNFPSRYVTDKQGNVVEVLPNMLEIGASTKDVTQLAADFSDYGQSHVDLFAPGQQIYSTIPGNSYAEFDGTSMATPEVVGIAALVLSQYPNLTVQQLKDVLLGNVTPYGGLSVTLPGTANADKPESVLFSTLSVTGGVVNAYQALKAAAKIQ